MVVDEVTTVAHLALVVVSLGESLVREELVGGELEDDAEAGNVEVLHADVGKMLEGSLIAVRDDLSKRNLVLHGRQPELRNTGNILGNIALLLLGFGGGVLLLLLLVLVLLGSLDLVIRGLDGAVDNLRTALVERGELGKVLLLKFENLLLELGLELGVLLLETLEAGDTAANRGREGLDVAGGATNQRSKTSLDHRDKMGVLGKDGRSRGPVHVLCGGVSETWPTGRGGAKQGIRMIRSRMKYRYIPSLMLETPGCWAWEEMGALFAGVF